jgi:hypothetical protein
MQNYWILETFRECKNTTRSFILIQLTEVSHQIANPNRKLSCTKISNKYIAIFRPLPEVCGVRNRTGARLEPRKPKKRRTLVVRFTSFAFSLSWPSVVPSLAPTSDPNLSSIPRTWEHASGDLRTWSLPRLQLV